MKLPFELVRDEEEVDLSEWTYLFTFGYSLDIYAYGSLRVAIDSRTGRKVISYIV